MSGESPRHMRVELLLVLLRGHSMAGYESWPVISLPNSGIAFLSRHVIATYESQAEAFTDRRHWQWG